MFDRLHHSPKSEAEKIVHAIKKRYEREIRSPERKRLIDILAELLQSEIDFPRYQHASKAVRERARNMIVDQLYDYEGGAFGFVFPNHFRYIFYLTPGVINRDRLQKLLASTFSDIKDLTEGKMIAADVTYEVLGLNSGGQPPVFKDLGEMIRLSNTADICKWPQVARALGVVLKKGLWLEQYRGLDEDNRNIIKIMIITQLHHLACKSPTLMMPDNVDVLGEGMKETLAKINSLMSDRTNGKMSGQDDVLPCLPQPGLTRC